jgi:spermidine synthase
VKPWETLDTATTPDGTTFTLIRHDGEYIIRADGYDLMVSRMHGSEEELAKLACTNLAPNAEVLIGGLGMGYTLRATLDLLPPGGRATVAELIPKVVEWNHGELGDLAGRPLDDPRSHVELADVADVIRQSEGRFAAILLDVDNGPDAFSQQDNARLYTRRGLAAIHRALVPKGVLAVWSTTTSAPGFEARLRETGFDPSSHRIRARGRAGGPWQGVFMGRALREVPPPPPPFTGKRRQSDAEAVIYKVSRERD